MGFPVERLEAQLLPETFWSRLFLLGNLPLLTKPAIGAGVGAEIIHLRLASGAA